VRRRIVVVTVVLLGAVGVLVGQGLRNWRASLRGFDETPAVSTVARGAFAAQINAANTEVAWTLRYSGLEGEVTQAHIHFGDVDTAGGISVWLCSNLASPPTPAGTQPCPKTPEVEISGTFTAANVVGPAVQGLAAGDFAELLEAIRAGLTYANVHSLKFPSGEVRGQLVPGRRNGNGDDHDDDDDDGDDAGDHRH
jgi:hypothetical protein